MSGKDAYFHSLESFYPSPRSVLSVTASQLGERKNQKMSHDS